MRNSKYIPKDVKAARKMPPLFHKQPGKDFSLDDSEVLAWIMSQPEVMEYIFDRYNSKGAIEYDRETGTWMGADYE